MNRMQLYRGLLGILIVMTATWNIRAGIVLIESFDEGNDNGWTRFDLTEGKPWGPGIFDASDGEYRLETTGMVTEPFEGLLISTWDRSEDEAAFSTGYLRAKVRAETSGTNPFLLMRAQDPDEGVNSEFYAFGGNIATGEIFIDMSGKATRVDPGIVDFQVGEDWIFEGGVIETDDGVVLSVKAWPFDDDEPSEPQLQILDSDPLLNAAFGVGAWVPSGNSATGAVFDDVYFTHASNPTDDGDYNCDGVVDAADIDLQAQAMNSPDPDLFTFDENADDVVDDHDRLIWIKKHARTWVGDADLNGEFNSADLIAVFTGGKYESGEMANWYEGDWDGNLSFGSGDLVAAFADGGYELGPLPAANAVPEPTSFLALVVGLLGIAMHRRDVAAPSANGRLSIGVHSTESAT